MGLPLNNQIPKNSTPQFQFFPFFFGIQCKYSGYPSKGGAERWSFSGPLSTFSHPKTCKDVKCVLKRLSLHYLQGHRYKNSNLEIKDFRKLVTHGIWVGWGRLKIDDSVHHWWGNWNKGDISEKMPKGFGGCLDLWLLVIVLEFYP